MVIMDKKKTLTSEKILFIGIFLLTVQLVICNAQEWDHFMFAQAWPPGTCADGTRENHTCHIDKRVKTWTIHGLWPSLGEEKGPTSCNSSWSFNETKIKSLEDQLDVYWPNLYSDSAHISFWQHEWSKHGTCCTDLASTAGEFNYFMAGLKLNKQYNILQMLAKGGVTASETAQYNYTDFIDAVKKVIGFEPVLQCTTRKQQSGETYHLIDQIQICLTKDFRPRSCSNGTTYPSGLDFSKGSYSLADFKKGEKKDFIGRRHSHHEYEPQSSCPKHYKFNYPPIHAVK